MMAKNRIFNIINVFGKPCFCCGTKTLRQLEGVILCNDCEEEGLKEIRGGDTE